MLKLGSLILGFVYNDNTTILKLCRGNLLWKKMVFKILRRYRKKIDAREGDSIASIELVQIGLSYL